MNFPKYLIALPLAAAAHFCVAQTSDSTEAGEETQAAVDHSQIEEIVTTGERSTWSRKFETIRAEDSVFEAFNAAFEGTDYEMVCSSGGVLRDEFTQNRPSPLNRTCVTSYVQEHEQVAIQEMLELGYSPTLDYLDSTIQDHNNELREKLLVLYQEDPEFRERFEEYAVLKRREDAAAAANGEEKSGGFLSRMFGGN